MGTNFCIFIDKSLAYLNKLSLTISNYKVINYPITYIDVQSTATLYTGQFPVLPEITHDGKEEL